MMWGFCTSWRYRCCVPICNSSSSKAESYVPDTGTDVASHSDHLKHCHQQCSHREDSHKSPFFSWQSLLVAAHTLVDSPSYLYVPSVSFVHLPESCYVLCGSFVFLAGTDWYTKHSTCALVPLVSHTWVAFQCASLHAKGKSCSVLFWLSFKKLYLISQKGKSDKTHGLR